MKLRSALIAAAAGLMLSTAAQAEVIAAKKMRLDTSHKMLIMLSDEQYTCDGDKDGRFGKIIVALDGAMRPSQEFKACYHHFDGTLNIIFWDPTSNDPRDAGTLEMSVTSFEKTPRFKSWDYIRPSATPSQ